MVSCKYGATLLIITSISHDWTRQTIKIRGDHSKKNDIGTICNSRFEIILFDSIMAGVSCFEEKKELRVFSTEREMAEFKSRKEIIVTQKHLNK